MRAKARIIEKLIVVQKKKINGVYDGMLEKSMSGAAARTGR